LDASIKKTEGLLETHNKLLAKYSEISPENIARLNKILPERIDVVRMIMDIDSLTTKHKIFIKSFEIPELDSPKKLKTKAPVTPEEEQSAVDSAILTVECTGDYHDLKAFLREIESSLSLTDVVSLDIATADLTRPGAVRELTFKVGLQTYWFK
jgi:Tfp pilus assembly protein PilO